MSDDVIDGELKTQCDGCTVQQRESYILGSQENLERVDEGLEKEVREGGCEINGSDGGDGGVLAT